MIALMLKALQTEDSYIYAAPSLEQAKKILFGLRINGKSFIKQLPPELIKKEPTISDMRIELVNNSVISFIGLSDVDSIVGSGARVIAISEATMLDSTAFAFLLPIVIFNKDAQLVMDYTPRAAAQWLHELSVNPPDIFEILEDMYNTGLAEIKELQSNTEDYAELKWGVRHGITQKEYEEFKQYYAEHKFISAVKKSLEDTGLLSPIEIELTKQTYLKVDGNLNRFKQEFLLDWNASDVHSIYGEQMETARNEGRVAPYLYNPKYDLNVSLDLGMGDFFVGVFWQKIGGRMYILDMYKRNSTSDDNHIRYLRDYKYPIKNIYMPHDANVRNVRDGKVRYQYFRDALPNKTVIHVEKTKSVVMDIIKIRGDYMANQFFNNQSSGVKELINELDSFDYVRDKNGNSSGRPQHSDIADAFRYASLNCYENYSSVKVYNRNT